METSTLILVRNQFAQVKRNETAFATGLFTHLFRLAPQLRPMFPTDLAGHCRKLMTTIAFAVGALDRPGDLEPVVRDLGARHVTYGVIAAHFAPVGAALLEALSDTLGNDFDPTARAAWSAVISTLANLMAEGMAAAKAVT